MFPHFSWRRMEVECVYYSSTCTHGISQNGMMWRMISNKCCMKQLIWHVIISHTFFYFIHKQKCTYHVADADKCVKSYAIKLAAEIQRIRIKHGVLHLSHLLPEHLKDNRVSNSVKNPITYGWINSYKIM